MTLQTRGGGAGVEHGAREMPSSSMRTSTTIAMLEHDLPARRAGDQAAIGDPDAMERWREGIRGRRRPGHFGPNFFRNTAKG